MKRPSEVTDVELEQLNKGICPTCRHRGFQWGPRGGMSQNYECANLACRDRFNIAFLNGRAMRAERIAKRIDGGSRWLSEPVPPV